VEWRANLGRRSLVRRWQQYNIDQKIRVLSSFSGKYETQAKYIKHGANGQESMEAGKACEFMSFS
jgi:hypothetical protein